MDMYSTVFMYYTSYLKVFESCTYVHLGSISLSCNGRSIFEDNPVKEQWWEMVVIGDKTGDCYI